MSGGGGDDRRENESPLPCSEACERNKGPILGVLEDVFEDCRTVLEIGSGSGQHAAYFAAHLPHLTWQASERPGTSAMLAERIRRASQPNLPPPVTLDVESPMWPVDRVDAVFSANTAHILSMDQVRFLFAGVGQVTDDNGCFVLYGPFMYNGQHTSSTNARFDQYLREQDPERGIRDVTELKQVAARSQFKLEDDRAMPANNRILIWRRRPRGENNRDE